MKKELKDFLQKAAKDIPPYQVSNRFRTIKKAYAKGGIDKVIETVKHYSTI